jgi:hypothetical protein
VPNAGTSTITVGTGDRLRRAHERRLAWHRRAHGHFAGVEALAELRRWSHLAIADRDREPRRGGLGELDDDDREPGQQRVGALARVRPARIVGRGARELRRGVVEEVPGDLEVAQLLVAVAEVELGADPTI